MAHVDDIGLIDGGKLLIFIGIQRLFLIILSFSSLTPLFQLSLSGPVIASVNLMTYSSFVCTITSPIAAPTNTSLSSL
jgi:hypothetical protein